MSFARRVDSADAIEMCKHAAVGGFRGRALSTTGIATHGTGILKTLALCDSVSKLS